MNEIAKALGNVINSRLQPKVCFPWFKVWFPRTLGVIAYVILFLCSSFFQLFNCHWSHISWYQSQKILQCYAIIYYDCFLSYIKENPKKWL